MLLLAMTSLWHWTQRADCTSKHLSVGHWQVSRVHAIRGDGLNARRNAERSLRFAEDASEFFIAYAHEALSRAALVLADHAEARKQLSQARLLAESLSDGQDKQMLMMDLEGISSQLR